MHETLAKGFHKGDVGVVGLDGQVDVVVFGRNITVDKGSGVQSVAGNGIYFHVSFFVVVLYPGNQRTHVALFEGEIVHPQVGVCVGIVEKCLYDGCASGTSAKLYGMEINQVEHVANVYIFEFDHERVVRIVGCGPVYGDELLAARNGELVEQHTIFAVCYLRRFHLPNGIAHGYVRLLERCLGSSLAFVVLKECGLPFQFAF